MTAPFFFWFFAALVVLGAVGVVAMRQPVHSALFLLLSFLGVAALFVMAHAEFLAAVQVLVYAGGIMVLFLFTIMLVNVRRTAGEPFVHTQGGRGPRRRGSFSSRSWAGPWSPPPACAASRTSASPPTPRGSPRRPSRGR